MIRRFHAVVQSATEPEDKHVIWIDSKDAAKYFNNGEWVPLPVAVNDIPDSFIESLSEEVE